MFATMELERIKYNDLRGNLKKVTESIITENKVLWFTRNKSDDDIVMLPKKKYDQLNIDAENFKKLTK